MKNPPLFFQRRFWPMWVTLSLGTFSDNVLRQALLIGVAYGAIKGFGGAGSDNALPFIGALLPLAIMLFSPFSGKLADKYETATMFRRTKFTELMLVIIAALAFASGSGVLALAMLFGMGAQSAFYAPVRLGAMPKYLEPNELVRGNGLCNAGLFGFILMGYMVGGALIAENNGGVKVGAVLIASSSLGFIASLFAIEREANDPAVKLGFNLIGDIAAMARHALTARGVAPPLFGTAAFFCISTAITIVTPLYARDALHGDAFTATILNGLFAIGAGIGAVGAASLSKGRSSLGFSTFAIGAAGLLTFAVLALTPFAAPPPGETFTPEDLVSKPAGLALALTFVSTSALMGVYVAPLQAAIQRRAPKATRARILAASTFANAAFAIPGSLSTAAITATGIPAAFAFPAAGVLMLAISALMLHRRRTLPDGLFDEMLKESPAASD